MVRRNGFKIGFPIDALLVATGGRRKSERRRSATSMYSADFKSILNTRYTYYFFPTAPFSLLQAPANEACFKCESYMKKKRMQFHVG